MRERGRVRAPGRERTLRALRRASIDLLRPWSSEMWPETADRSAWKVDRNEARSDKSWVLDCGRDEKAVSDGWGEGEEGSRRTSTWS